MIKIENVKKVKENSFIEQYLWFVIFSSLSFQNQTIEDSVQEEKNKQILEGHFFNSSSRLPFREYQTSPHT